MSENIIIEQQNILPFQIGEKWFFRTVTYFMTGEIVSIKGKFLILKDAGWIPDTGRFSNAIKNGDFDEVEPIDVRPVLNTDSIVDAFPWPHKLPRDQK